MSHEPKVFIPNSTLLLELKNADNHSGATQLKEKCCGEGGSGKETAIWTDCG